MTDAISAEMSFDVLAKAVDDAAAAVAELDEVPRELAGALRAAIEAVHKAGLATIVRRLRADDAGRALLFELVDDPLIRMLFSLHGIIRTDTPAGVGAAGEHTGKQPSGSQSSGSLCGCGSQSDGCGCGHSHGVPQQSEPTLIPLSAIGRPAAAAASAGPAAFAAGDVNTEDRGHGLLRQDGQTLTPAAAVRRPPVAVTPSATAVSRTAGDAGADHDGWSGDAA
jgi:hypothetical protein